MRALRRSLAFVAAASLLVLLVPPGASHAAWAYEHGTLALHFDNSDDGCIVTVEGRHIASATGVLGYWSAPSGPSGPELEHEETIVGTPEPSGGGWRFTSTPLNVSALPGTPDWILLAIGEEDPSDEYHGREHSISLIGDFDLCRNDDLVNVYDPGTLGEPECTFHAEGRHLLAPEGQLLIEPEHGDPILVDVDIENETDGEGWRFVFGPHTVEIDQRYHVTFAYEEGSGTIHSHALGTSFRADGCGPEAAPPDDCAPLSSAWTHDNGTIELRWIDTADTDGTRIYRAADGSDPILLDDIASPGPEFQEMRYFDETTAVGTAYTYRLVSYNDQGDTEDECPVLEATAVPLFGSPLILALAAVGAIGAYAWNGRRRGT